MQPVVPDTSSACPQACARRVDLACIEPQFVADCVTNCYRFAAAGLFDAECTAHASSREAMKACRVRCP